MAGQTMLLKATEVAKIMGISLRAVYRLKDDHKLPYVQWNRSVRFDKDEVQKFIDANRKEA